jgi:hypothetical protein
MDEKVGASGKFGKIEFEGMGIGKIILRYTRNR